tara:strand:+ start:860 stop:2404 length:1545 start_codon:yes stop_codon:yes gene_type:complete
MAVYEEKWYTGTTSPGPYNFTFPYIKEADVKVEKNGTLLTLTTEYTQATTSITLVSNPAETDIIRVYRDTDSENLSSTFYPGSAIRSSDLNDNFTQSLYSSQESAEKAKDALRATDAFIATTSNEGDTWVTAGNGTTHGQDPNPDPRGIGYAVTTSEAADVKSDAAVETADDAELLVHTYVADGNGNLKGGGAPDGQPEGVKYAVDVAVAADNIADGAKVDADNAILATDSLVGTTTDGGATWTLKGDGISPNPQGVAYAVGKADDAVADATAALNNSQDLSLAPGNTSAIDVAKDAKTIATDADNIADAAKLATDTYVHDGTSLKGDGIGSNPKGVAYAVSVAEEASASVAASAIYKVVADLSALTTDYPLTGNQPSPPGADPLNLVPTPDGTYIQITDSTGISLLNGTWAGGAFSGASSFPNGFDGNSQLTLRVKVSNASAGSETYIAQEYYANDPEARYGEDRKVVVENNRTITENYTIQTTMNALSVGPVSIDHGKFIAIPPNSKYVVLN